MRLTSAVLGFLLRKMGLFVGVLACLFITLLLVSVLVPTIREAESERHHLQEVTERRASLEDDLDQLQDSYAASQVEAIATLSDTINAEVSDRRQQVADQESDVSDLKKDRDASCGLVESLLGKVPYVTTKCEAKRKLYDAAVDVRDTYSRNLARAENDAAVLRDPQLSNEQKLDRLGQDGQFAPAVRKIDAKRAELDQTKSTQRSLQESQGSWAGWVVSLWARSWRYLVGIALLTILMPPLLRTVSYFVLMPLVSRAQTPMQLADETQRTPASLLATTAERTLRVDLADGEVLSARSEHVRPVQGDVRSRLLYDWTSPFISYAAGLYGLSRVTGDADDTSATLATPDDPDSYLMRIDFADHPGLVIHPKHIVGVIGAPELETRWRWGIQSFATWQVRYIMFTGTGSLIVQGSGDVVATDPRGRATRMEQNLVMGFDSRLALGVRRTEVFWPYLWGRTPLVDEEFTGSGSFLWQKSTSQGPSSPIARTFDAIFSAVGKLLGF